MFSSLDLHPSADPLLPPNDPLHICDTLSESSDNATLHSLTGDDLAAIGAGPIREDVRVNRKKLESLILREREMGTGGKSYMESLMERTNTFIQWPSRMKIGAKTKKDLYIRVYGHSVEEVGEAKGEILADLGPHRDLRITLKMEISYTDHSHLIGCRGATIRKVMEESRCHIHFPDSNRMSKEHKSNQVTIAGSSIVDVETARSRVRELSPLILQFCLPSMHSPYGVAVNPDGHHVFLENIQNSLNVQVTIHPPNKLQQTAVSVKGCEVNALTIMDAVNKIIAYFSPNHMSAFVVECTMEISSIQHAFVRGVNDTNVHSIMLNTGAKIIFPDLSDGNIQTIKRSRVLICGQMRAVYQARQQLIGCLPLRMVFDLSDDFHLEWEGVRSMGSELNVNIKLINRNKGGGGGGNDGRLLASLPPPIPGRSRTIQLVAAERNASNIFEVRRRILGSLEPPCYANVPHSYQLRQTGGGGGGGGNNFNRASLPPLLVPSSPSILSPLLSPNFWPPSPFGFPSGPPRGFHSSFYSNSSGQGSSLTSSGLPSPVNPPEHPMMSRQHLTLPLGGFAASTALNTPMSMGSSIYEPSPMTPMHPGVNMVNALINDFDRIMELERRAPGAERPPERTYDDQREIASSAELYGGAAPQPTPPSPPPTHVEEQQLEEEEEVEVKEEKKEEEPSKDDRMSKKYGAVQAMYAAKIGPHARAPNSEWAGCGFSKTTLALYPAKKEEESKEMGHAPLVHHHSDLQDIVSRSGGAEGPPKNDLPALLIGNRLEKYVDVFMSEEIDLGVFAMLTETDLRGLGVTSYSARKKMLVLISQLKAPLTPLP